MNQGTQASHQTLCLFSTQTLPAQAAMFSDFSLISNSSHAWLVSRPGHGWPATELAALLPAAGTEAATESVSSRRREQCR